jgi:hypothetical protein
MATSNERKIEIAHAVSENLAFRNSADDLFSHIEDFKEKNIIIDFSGIKTITRSFAHQYTLNKKKSKKNISEINMPKDIAKMFDLLVNKKPQRRYYVAPKNVLEVTV